MTEIIKEYLGDGVYASYDGYHIWLRTERATGVHEVALEPAVLQALNRYKTVLPDRINQWKKEQEI